jgi:hypothetical protein
MWPNRLHLCPRVETKPSLPSYTANAAALFGFFLKLKRKKEEKNIL